VIIRDGGPDDLAAVQRTLFLALAWSPDPDMPPADVVMRHPEVARYHRDWGRAGDAVVIAERGGEFIGAAFYRLFTENDHGHGFVNEQTPELAIAIEDMHRGDGVGRQLMDALRRQAMADGVPALSLSVKRDNPARHLYSKLGYEILTEDEPDLRMLLRINQTN
jgi:ribosomal protein S18 acetylase RimI-like enzyme